MHTSASAIAESRRPHTGKLSQASLLHQSDEGLVLLARSGSERAWAEITRRYGRQLRVYCARFVGISRAEDAVQQTFLQAFLSLRDGHHREIVLRAWLYRIAHNCSIDLLRKGPTDYDELDLEYDGVAQPPTVFEQREEVRRLVARMRDLPDAQRQALALRELEGRSYEEISAQLGHSGSGVRQLIFRARTALRNSAAGILPLGLLKARLTQPLPLECHHVATAVSVPASSGGGIDVVGAATLAVVAVLGGGFAAADGSSRRAKPAQGKAEGALVSRPAVVPAAPATPPVRTSGLSIRLPGRHADGRDAAPIATAPVVPAPAVAVPAAPTAVPQPIPPAGDAVTTPVPDPQAPGSDDIRQQTNTTTSGTAPAAPGTGPTGTAVKSPPAPGTTVSPVRAPTSPPRAIPPAGATATVPAGSGRTTGAQPAPPKASPPSSPTVRKPVKAVPAKPSPKAAPPKSPQSQKLLPKAAPPKAKAKAQAQAQARTSERG